MNGTRDIGRVGTLARLVGGVPLIAVPIAGHGISWWDLAGALIALPLIAEAVAGAFRLRHAGAKTAASNRARAAGAIVLVVVIATALTFVTPIDGGAIWMFFGASMLLAAVRGYAGCELLTIANAFSGRREQMNCLVYDRIDEAELRRMHVPGSGPR